MLWNSTQMKAHYRSIFAQADDFASSGSSTTCTCFYYPTIEFGARFWTAAGGAQPIDTAVAVPTFQDDIILRGGMINLNVCNVPASLDIHGDIQVTVWLIISDEQPSVGALIPPDGSTGTTATFSREWDPSCVPDFQRVFCKKILMKKTALLKDLESLNVSYRLRIQKIDQENYLNDNNKLYWVVKVAGNHGFQDDYRVTASYNLSFSGDAV